MQGGFTLPIIHRLRLVIGGHTRSGANHRHDVMPYASDGGDMSIHLNTTTTSTTIANHALRNHHTHNH
jgi:hypothetical protein